MFPATRYLLSEDGALTVQFPSPDVRRKPAESTRHGFAAVTENLFREL